MHLLRHSRGSAPENITRGQLPREKVVQPLAQHWARYARPVSSDGVAEGGNPGKFWTPAYAGVTCVSILGFVVLTVFPLGCATFRSGPPTATRVTLDYDKDLVFQAALGTLQEMALDMRTVDAQNGTLKTKRIDSQVDSHTSLHYEILVSITQPEAGKSEVQVSVTGEKIHKMAGMSYSTSLDESDPDMKTNVERILAATSDKVKSPIP